MKDHDFGKTIVRPNLVESISQHTVLKTLPGYETSDLSSTSICAPCTCQGRSWLEHSTRMLNSISDPPRVAPDKSASRLESGCHRHMLETDTCICGS